KAKEGTMSFAKAYETLGSFFSKSKQQPLPLFEPNESGSTEPTYSPVPLAEHKTPVSEQILTIPELWEHSKRPEEISEGNWYRSVKLAFIFLRDYIDNGQTYEERTNPCKAKCKKSLWVLSLLFLGGSTGSFAVAGFLRGEKLTQDRATFDEEAPVIYSGI